MNHPTADEVRKSSMATLADTHVVYIEAVREIVGHKGLKMIGEANRSHGIKLGMNAIQNGNLRRGDLKSIYDFFKAAHPFFGFELEIDDITDTKLDLKITYCPWLDSFKARGAHSDICKWVTLIDDGIGKAVDPELCLTLTSCMMRGDDYCIYRWSKS